MAKKQAWTKEKPLEDGLYWAIPVLPRGVTWERGPIAQMVSVENVGEDEFVVFMTGKDYSYSLGEFTLWLGPVTPPEPPQE